MTNGRSIGVAMLRPSTSRLITNQKKTIRSGPVHPQSSGKLRYEVTRIRNAEIIKRVSFQSTQDGTTAAPYMENIICLRERPSNLCAMKESQSLSSLNLSIHRLTSFLNLERPDTGARNKRSEVS
mmetsp:Transcript_4425/g.11077  ORF Transcript_4425/g.11077 Transcript_4425/m.11077 type:complete len:125 (-) Transcript_4425:2109-2483(-)